MNNCTKAIEYCAEVLGAEVVRRFDGPDGTVMHAEMRLGEAMFARAVAAGATTPSRATGSGS